MSQGRVAITTSQLSKRYGAVVALDGIDLHVPTGVTYGFLGPNGAGKTTTIRVLLGFIRPSSGVARIDGYDCWRDGVRARGGLGYLVPAEALYPDMTGEALLEYIGALSARPPILRGRLLDALELGTADLRRPLGAYSKGMKQKLALTAAIQTNPPLLILDEPTDGLDPLIQRSFEAVLADLHARGTTIFMSSHDLAEVERTCERVAIIRDGRIAAEETIGDLKALRRRSVEITFAGDPPPAIDRLPGLHLIRRNGRRLTVSLEGDFAPFLRFLATRDDVVDLLIAPPRLEEVFLGFYDTERPLTWHADDGRNVEHLAMPAGVTGE